MSEHIKNGIDNAQDLDLEGAAGFGYFAPHVAEGGALLDRVAVAAEVTQLAMSPFSQMSSSVGNRGERCYRLCYVEYWQS